MKLKHVFIAILSILAIKAFCDTIQETQQIDGETRNRLLAGSTTVPSVLAPGTTIGNLYYGTDFISNVVTGANVSIK